MATGVNSCKDILFVLKEFNDFELYKLTLVMRKPYKPPFEMRLPVINGVDPDLVSSLSDRFGSYLLSNQIR